MYDKYDKKKISKSSKIWLKQQFKDKYVIKAKKNNLRSRAWFKLEEIQKKENIFKKNMNVVDLGSTPGGWSKYAIEKIGKRGSIIACDILPMQPIKGVYFIQGDLREKMFFNKFLEICNNKNIKVLMSDMSPNISGISTIDIPKSLNLLDLSLDICNFVLKKNGIFVIKFFQGDEFNKTLKKIKFIFKNVKVRKLNTSRSKSREVYIIAKGKI